MIPTYKSTKGHICPEGPLTPSGISFLVLVRVLIDYDADVLKFGPKFKVNFKCSWWNCRTNSHRTKNMDQIPSSTYHIDYAVFRH